VFRAAFDKLLKRGVFTFKMLKASSIALDVGSCINELKKSLVNVGPMEIPSLFFSRLGVFIKEISLFQSSLGLLSKHDYKDNVNKHVLESLFIGAKMRLNATVLDIGSGGGFPAIPMAILRPDLAVVLVERKVNKVHFLDHVKNKLGLNNVSIFSMDIKHYIKKQDHLLSESDITARAVWPWQEYLKKIIPNLKKGANLWIFTTPRLTLNEVNDFIFALKQGEYTSKSMDFELSLHYGKRRFIVVHSI